MSGLFDHSFEHALDERDASRLDWLEIDGRKKVDLVLITDRLECLVERATGLNQRMIIRRRGRVWRLENMGDGRDPKIDDLLADDSNRDAASPFRAPSATKQDHRLGRRRKRLLERRPSGHEPRSPPLPPSLLPPSPLPPPPPPLRRRRRRFFFGAPSPPSVGAAALFWGFWLASD